jgi:hypothetical protein
VRLFMILIDKYMNTQNNIEWSRQNPHLLYEISLSDIKVGVLYIPGVRKITGPVIYVEMIISESYKGQILHRSQKNYSIQYC